MAKKTVLKLTLIEADTLVDILDARMHLDVVELHQGARLVVGENGAPKIEMATCAECGASWNDAMVTDRTPVPAGRCPFENSHIERSVLRKLAAKGR